MVATDRSVYSRRRRRRRGRGAGQCKGAVERGKELWTGARGSEAKAAVAAAAAVVVIRVLTRESSIFWGTSGYHISNSSRVIELSTVIFR
jgi:hypothetical protein